MVAEDMAHVPGHSPRGDRGPAFKITICDLKTHLRSPKRNSARSASGSKRLGRTMALWPAPTGRSEEKLSSSSVLLMSALSLSLSLSLSLPLWLSLSLSLSDLAIAPRPCPYPCPYPCLYRVSKMATRIPLDDPPRVGVALAWCAIRPVRSRYLKGPRCLDEGR
jgi:hypothetical protein